MSVVDPKTSVYKGSKRKLVLAFDIGTTFSGISYSILDPGHVPEIKGVMRFPAHEQISGASKIPTVLYYDKKGVMKAAGAEAVREGIYELAMDGDWDKAEWFKLRIRSERGTGATPVQFQDMLPPLPQNKTVIQILADFMRYLRMCAKEYIQDTHANGRDLWASVEKEIDYVISHPNGWEGYQQSQMRHAAILSGLIPDSISGRERVTFVTEGEASLHYAIRNGLPMGALNDGEGIIIVDAGGGTVDLSAYRKKPGSNSDSFDEIAVPQCHFHGSAFVTVHARIFISKLLEDSDFIDDIDHITRRFDLTTKPRFRSDQEPQFIRFGGNRDNDDACGIRYGQLKLQGEDVAGFFTPSIKCIVDAVQRQLNDAHHPISHVILVGGFASSDWLYGQVDKALGKLKGQKLTVIRPENYINKAVSDGAVSFFLQRRVMSRVSKYAYGICCKLRYDPDIPEHKLREKDIQITSDGRKKIAGAWRTTIPKNIKIEENVEYRTHTRQTFSSHEAFKSVVAQIWCYRGDNPNPEWHDTEPEMYSKLCQIIMDLSHLPYEEHRKVDGSGVFYRVSYDYVLCYKGVELKAQMAWKENGVEKRSVAHVVYDPTDFY